MCRGITDQRKDNASSWTKEDLHRELGIPIYLYLLWLDPQVTAHQLSRAVDTDGSKSDDGVGYAAVFPEVIIK